MKYIKKRIQVVILMGIFAGFSGCDTAVNTAQQPFSGETTLDDSDLSALNLDEQFALMAEDIEGFGGMYYDENGRLVVFLKDPQNQLDRAMEMLPTKYENMIGQQVASKMASVEVKKANYDFAELKRWADRSLDVMSIDGVLWYDIDESENRLTIGVDEGMVASVRASIEEAMTAFDVPRAAFEIKASAPAASLATLAQKVRPMKGGLEIESGVLPGLTFRHCTLGFHALRTSNTEYGFVTNSHCTANMGVVNGDTFFQDDYGVGSEEIGVETIDPPFWSSGGGAKSRALPCPTGKFCRNSDAAYIKYEDISGSDISFAKIHRTTYSGTTTGSTTISGDFTITAEASSHVMGTTLQKIGKSSGWTYGNISATCVTRNVPSSSTKVLLCQYEVDAGAVPGDSGSPVFKLSGSGNNVTLYGILWGVNTGNNDFIYSPISSVKSEVGPIVVK